MNMLYTLLGVGIGCVFLYFVAGEKFSSIIDACLGVFDD